ncbi:MAG: HD-GYP domain-containing protein [Dehalococcoidia bacterium]|nr:MAG: HD-GYP domain-containing protein [Dehalococcoidia bacterium]
MRRALPQVAAWVGGLAASTAFFAVLHWQASLDQGLSWKSPVGHVWIVSSVSFLALVVGVVATVTAWQRTNARTLWVALGFLSMAGFFFMHGLVTPGFLVGRDYSYLAGFSSRLAVSSAAFCLAASAVDWPEPVSRRLVAWRHAVILVAGAVLVGYAAVGLRAPEILPKFLVTAPVFGVGTLIGVTLFAGFAVVRYVVGYVRSGLPMFGAMAIGAAMLVQATYSMHFGKTWTGMFWLYHLQLLFGYSAIGWGLFWEFSRGRAHQAIDDLSVTDVVEQLRRGHTESVVSLAAALEARDGYTLGHGERVAALAILIGQEMRLSPARLRALAAGALLHDVGKIGIPDAVLHKPGLLTLEETAVIREHPARGDKMVSTSFSGRVECAVIRHHHERWDGTGYPDGLVGEAIPLEARIAAVADVYDALRSNRAYRPALTAEDALALIERDSGTHFDPRCAAAFVRVVVVWEQRYADDSLVYHERRVA